MERPLFLERKASMGLILSLIVGAALGWASSLLMRASAAQGILLNIIVGVIGALLGAFLFGPLLGGGNLLDAAIDPMTIVVSMIGAVLLLAALYVSRSRRGR